MAAMNRLKQLARKAQDRGASAVEYGLMVAAIAAVVVWVIFGLGSLVHTAFSKTCSTMAVGPASLGDPVKDCGAAPAETSTEPPAGG
jgi:pilus assembly protein Flp/PilA